MKPEPDAEDIFGHSELPKCRHFGECGGCSLLNITYEEQLQWKHAVIVRSMKEFPALAELRVEPVRAAPWPLHYRNRLLYPLIESNGKVLAGFFRRNTHELVDIHECRIQDPAITAIARVLVRGIRELAIPILEIPGTSPAQSKYDSLGSGAESDELVQVTNKRSPGSEAAVRAIAVRLAPGTGEVMVAVVTTGGLFPKGAELAAGIVRATRGFMTAADRPAKVISVLRNINDSETNVVLGKRTLPLLGRDYLMDRFLRMRFRVSLLSFFQPNATAARAAIDMLVKNSGDLRDGVVIDAYAGVGAIALALARKSKRVIAIENVSTAVADGAANVKMNGIENVEFLAGDVTDALATLKLDAPPALVVLDPPRSGLRAPALAAVVNLRPNRIAYLSCSPQSLARDLDVLIAAGYRVERMTPFDFFPHTEHVEVLAFLADGNAAAGVNTQTQ